MGTPREPRPVTLRDRILSELTAAMRSGDALRRDTLRMVWAAVYNVEKARRDQLADDDVVAVLSREVKTRRESVDAFRKGSRIDLAAKEEAEIAIIGEFLPAPLSDEELGRLVREAIAATGAASPRDIGKVMGFLGPRTKGRADGRRVSELVVRELASPGLAR